MSSTTLAVRFTYTHNVPVADSFTTNSFAMLSPGWKLTLDVGGFVPHGNAVAYPFVVAPVMVRFTTAASASNGTPARPATGISTRPPDGIGPAPVKRPSTDTNPGRVSANRTGVNGTYSETAGAYPATSRTTWAVRCTYTHTVPVDDSFATNSLAMLSPGWKLMLDVGGRVPHGNAVAYPFVTAPVMVRFTTAASASNGTPPRPATGISTIPPDGTGPAPVNRPSTD